ncbi:hypothetical protein CROQUDRAFT_133323 [Cronartium quercuum f. sp. fusiforme G11]|uniref:Uncharacterized protein n=1 Tax=Cronartium quercuum f. sp. fusiforme G11 TaxID=708437 RepID=A0A9P6TCZ9_9BASI|nr:hypothetical protein CROQUDRAFT_133323 [Cronartium quercuum f. sp. fusiforme G11]
MNLLAILSVVSLASLKVVCAKKKLWGCIAGDHTVGVCSTTIAQTNVVPGIAPTYDLSDASLATSEGRGHPGPETTADYYYECEHGGNSYCCPKNPVSFLLLDIIARNTSASHY